MGGAADERQYLIAGSDALANIALQEALIGRSRADVW